MSKIISKGRLSFPLIILSAIVLIIAMALQVSIAQAQVFPLGMISYWKFEEGSGTIAMDSVNGNDGNLIDDANWTTGIVGTALSFNSAFDGTHDMVVIPHSSNLTVGNATESFSVEAWFNTSASYGTSDNQGTIVGKDSGVGKYPFDIGVGSTGGVVSNHGYLVVNAGGGVFIRLRTQIAVNDGNWHHIVGIRDRSGSNKILLYLDGVKVAEAADPFGSLDLDDSDNITIGCGSDQPIGSNICHQRPFKGLIDEVAIYNRVLMEAEILQHYQVGLIGLGYEVREIATCIGFEPPMDNGPVTVKKNRALPLKAVLNDASGLPITNTDIVAPPVIQVLFDSGISGEDPVDVTDDALPAGQGTEGNQFEFSSGKWHFNLKTKNYTALGTYTTSMVSGDSAEYVIDPTCVGIFVIE